MKWVRLRWKRLVTAAVWTNPDVIVVVVALGFQGVCEVGEISMEASRCGIGVDQPRRDRRRRGIGFYRCL